MNNVKGQSRSIQFDTISLLLDEFIFEKAKQYKIDIRDMKALSVEEWSRINYHLHKDQIEKNALEVKKKEREEMLKKSRELSKDWKDTRFGAKKKKLQEIMEKMTKKEEERKKIDAEEADFSKEARKKAIEDSNVKVFYNQSRINEFNVSGLILYNNNRLSCG
ncbi:hypothetical protein Ciccas_003670 [Cichlidogyrus casuarinus]|uniref:Uncharacterized protein n=1 Tax=Cichlidogyrus casuarinus TaxID=1844966 RepID=A0ABD2QDW5_9PLAT